MQFDVIIPSKGRKEDIYRMIDSIFTSTELPKNIIIIDQSDKPYDLHKYENKGINIIHHIDPTVSGASVARNIGVDLATSEYVFIFDDDIILDANFFEVINKHFKEFPKVVGICGRQKNSKSSRLKVFIFSLFHVGEFKDERKKYNSGLIKEGIYPVTMLSGGIVGFKREIFNEIRFDDIYIRGSLGEDRDFSYRLSRKYPLMFATDALAIHNHSKIGRYDVVEEYACKVASYSVFYIKNMKKNIKNYISYKLVIAGIWLDALFYSMKHKNLSGIRGIKKGYSYIKNNFEGVPFIDSDKYRERYISKK